MSTLRRSGQLSSGSAQRPSRESGALWGSPITTEFVPNFSTIATPLTALTKKDAPFIWSDQCEEAFKRLKALLISAPVLAQWDPTGRQWSRLTLRSMQSVGALSQYDDDGTLRPVAFFSRKNNPAECNYSIHDKELLAVICCLKQWDDELRSVPSFEVWTDHKNLEYFYRKQQLSERQVRWAEKCCTPIELCHRAQPRPPNPAPISPTSSLHLPS